MIATEYHVQYARTERGKKARDDARIRRQKEESLRRYLEKAILRCDDFLAIDYVEEIPQCDRDIEKLTVELNEHLAWKGGEGGDDGAEANSATARQPRTCQKIPGSSQGCSRSCNCDRG